MFLSLYETIPAQPFIVFVISSSLLPSAQPIVVVLPEELEDELELEEEIIPEDELEELLGVAVPVTQII